MRALLPPLAPLPNLHSSPDRARRASSATKSPRTVRGEGAEDAAVPPRHSPRRLSVPKLDSAVLAAAAIHSEEALQQAVDAQLGYDDAARADGAAAPPPPASEDAQSDLARARSDSKDSCSSMP